MQPSTPCSICGRSDAQTGATHCDGCAGLLRWVASYYSDLPNHAEVITPATTWSELGVDSLDYVDWLLEAETTFNVVIHYLEAERIHTVGGLVRRLSLEGAAWGSDRRVEIHKGRFGIRRFNVVPASRPGGPDAG